MGNKINEPYIYALFYNKYDPNEYLKSVVKLNERSASENISSFGNYIFKGINVNSLEEKYVYIFIRPDIQLIQQLYPDANIKVYDNFAVVYFN